MTTRILINAAVVVSLIVGCAACGGSGSPSAPAGNDGTIAATITIDATGNVTPKDLTVPADHVTTITSTTATRG